MIVAGAGVTKLAAAPLVTTITTTIAATSRLK